MPAPAKLTDDQVMEIYIRAWDGEGSQDLSNEFGVPIGYISGVKHGHKRSNVTGHNGATIRPTKTNLGRKSRDKETVLEIYRRAWSGEETFQQIGDAYGITSGAVNAIKHGDSYQHFTGHIKGVTGSIKPGNHSRALPIETTPVAEVVEPITEEIPVETVVPAQIPISTSDRPYSNMMLECLLDADDEIYPGLVVCIKRLKELEAELTPA